jgi:hypothetical protein
MCRYSAQVLVDTIHIALSNCKSRHSQSAAHVPWLYRTLIRADGRAGQAVLLRIRCKDNSAERPVNGHCLLVQHIAALQIPYNTILLYIPITQSLKIFSFRCPELESLRKQLEMPHEMVWQEKWN